MAQYLIQRFTEKGIGRIFLATPELLSRADMHPYEGPVPPDMIVKIGEAALSQPLVAPYEMDFESGAIVVPTAETTTKESVDAVVANDDPPMPDLDDVAAPTPVSPPLAPQDKIVKLVEILGDKKLFPNDSEHYTAQGLPRIDALIHVFGQDVQAKERNAAWETYNNKK